MTGAMPLSWPIQSVPISPVFVGSNWMNPQLLLLRELSRAEETLLEDFRRSANRLRDQLHRFYPQMLQLCSAADESWLWDLIDLAPTPAHAALLSEEQVQRVLKTHRIRRVKAKEVLTCLQAPALPVAPGAAEAAQAHCGFLLPCLRVLAEQLQACSQQVSALLHTLAEEPGEGEGPSDVAIVHVSAWGRSQDHRLALCRSRPALGRARLSGVAHAWRGRPSDEAKWQAPSRGDAARV